MANEEHSNDYCDQTEDCAEHQAMVDSVTVGHACLLFDGTTFPDSPTRYRVFAWVQFGQLGIEAFTQGPDGHWKEMGRPSIPLAYKNEAVLRLQRFLAELPS